MSTSRLLCRDFTRAPVEHLDPVEVAALAEAALAEDLGDEGDLTSLALIPEGQGGTAEIRAKEQGIICGLHVAGAVFAAADPTIRWHARCGEGAEVEAGAVVAEIAGFLRGILAAERTALNFLGRMSGIATLTRRFVSAIEGTGAAITDTRKTAPGLRRLDKYAVRTGGGVSHRLGLWDMLLIKDNHIAVGSGVHAAVDSAKTSIRERPDGKAICIAVETTTTDDVDEALAAGADRIMLDNMSIDEVRAAVKRIRGVRDPATGLPEIEVSGNVTLRNVRSLAECGPDVISIGALTHSPYCLDLSLCLVVP